MHIIENVLNVDELTWIRAVIRRSRFVDGGATAAGSAQRVKANEQIECSREDAQKLVHMVFAALKRSAKFNRCALPLEISLPSLNRYAQGMRYGPHYDAPFMQNPEGPKIRGDLSATLFIADPESYDGGELCFRDAEREESVKLKAGQLLLYPANRLHWVNPVTRGVRLAVIFWLQSTIRDHEKRRMIAELDDSIASLASLLPADSPDLRFLAGMESNLLRMWSEL